MLHRGIYRSSDSDEALPMTERKSLIKLPKDGLTSLFHSFSLKLRTRIVKTVIINYLSSTNAARRVQDVSTASGRLSRGDFPSCRGAQSRSAADVGKAGDLERSTSERHMRMIQAAFTLNFFTTT